jgi:hypothetical protein
MVIAAKVVPADAGAPRGYEKEPTATRWPHRRTALKCARTRASNSASVSSRRWKGFGVFLSAYVCFFRRRDDREAAGRENPPELAHHRIVIQQVLDGLERDDDIDRTVRQGDGLARADDELKVAARYFAWACAIASGARSTPITRDAEPPSMAAPYPSPVAMSEYTFPRTRPRQSA